MTAHARTPLPADVLIIGAGASGAVAAKRLGEAGFNVVCLEQGDWADYSRARGDKADFELTAGRDWAWDPNARAGAADYPVNDAESDITALMWNGVGGGTVVVKPGYALSPCGNDIVVCHNEPVNVCDRINRCRPPSNDCLQPAGRVNAADCNQGDEDWILAICYQEKPSRGITALRGASCRCGGGCQSTGGEHGTRNARAAESGAQS